MHPSPLAPGLALAALLATSGPAAAAPPGPEGPAWVGLHPVTWTFARVRPALAPDVSAMRVERDPETGSLGPAGPAAAARLAALAGVRPEAEPLHVQRLPDGSLMIDLGERFMMDFRVTRAADGQLHAACSDAHAHTHGAVAPAWPEE
jgi:hypothetical protein